MRPLAERIVNSSLIRWATARLRARAERHAKAEQEIAVAAFRNERIVLLAAARADRAIALDRFRAAHARRDTRGKHVTERPAVHATCAQLAAEIGRAPSAWRGR